MEAPAFNVTDAAIALVILVSGAFAFYRGMARELFSLAGWVGAFAATYFGFSAVQPYAREIIETPLFADGAAALGLFVFTLVAVSLLSGALVKRIKESRLSALDRSLGFLFGLVRGAVLVSVAYVALTWMTPPEQQPPWLRDARTMPLVMEGARLVALAIPPEARAEWVAAMAGDEGGAADEAARHQRALDTLLNPPPPAAADADKPGYSSAERGELDRLIDNVQ